MSGVLGPSYRLPFSHPCLITTLTTVCHSTDYLPGDRLISISHPPSQTGITCAFSQLLAALLGVAEMLLSAGWCVVSGYHLPYLVSFNIPGAFQKVKFKKYLSNLSLILRCSFLISQAHLSCLLLSSPRHQAHLFLLYCLLLFTVLSQLAPSVSPTLPCQFGWLIVCILKGQKHLAYLRRKEPVLGTAGTPVFSIEHTA